MTSPTPSVNDLQQTVADLARRVRDLETGVASKPAATALPVAAYPYSAGDTSRWAGFSSLDYRTFYTWWTRMEWSALDVSVVGTTTGDRAGQWRIVCGDTVLYEAPTIPGNTTAAAAEQVVDLADLLAQPGVLGGLREFRIEGRVVGGTAGAFYCVPERLLLTGARFV